MPLCLVVMTLLMASMSSKQVHLVIQSLGKKSYMEQDQVNMVVVSVQLIEPLANELSVRQWSGRPGFNPRSSHTKDSKSST